MILVLILECGVFGSDCWVTGELVPERALHGRFPWGYLVPGLKGCRVQCRGVLRDWSICRLLGNGHGARFAFYPEPTKHGRDAALGLMSARIF